MAGFLVLADGSRVAVQNDLTLGRVAQCDIVLKDTKASRRHARLVVEGSVVEIEDLGSSNGTYLNDKPIKRRLLRDGDEIRIGMTKVKFVEAAEELAGGVDVEIEPEGAVPTDRIQPRPEPAPNSDPDPYRPGGGLEGDPLVGKEPPVPSDDVEVLEFVDEVVTVRKRSPAPSPVPEVSTASPAARAGAPGREHGVLSYSKRGADRGGLLGDDMRQMSPSQRVLLTIVVLAVALALGYVVMKLVAAT